MKPAKIQIIASLVILSFAGFLFWMHFKPAPKPPVSEFQQGQIDFKKRMLADNDWYHQADAHGLSYKKYMPLELAATNATIQEINHVAKRPDWGSLTVAERTQITDEVNRKADAARQAMRASYYTKPFKPDW